MKKVFLLILFLCISTLITSTAAFANDEVSDLIKDTTKNIGGNSCISKNLDTISSNYTAHRKAGGIPAARHLTAQNGYSGFFCW